MKMKNPMFGGPDDKDIEHLANTLVTQQAIIKYAKEMAVVLAEAGRASQKARGDSAETAVRKWADVIVQEALRLLREDAAPNLKKLVDMEKLLDENPGSMGKEGDRRLLEDDRRLQRKAD